MAAVWLASRYRICKTDVRCSWTPKPLPLNEIKNIRELFNIPKPARVTKRNLNNGEVLELREALSKEIECGFNWILADEPDELECNIGCNKVVDIESIISSQEYINAIDRNEWIKKKLEITATEINEIANETIGQTENVKWFQSRRMRITASNFGAVIGAITRNKYPPSLFNRLIRK